MAPVDVETLPPSRAYSLGGFVARAEALLNISANAFKVYGKLGKRVEQKKVRMSKHQTTKCELTGYFSEP
jgi:hypothetical protein